MTSPKMEELLAKARARIAAQKAEQEKLLNFSKPTEDPVAADLSSPEDEMIYRLIQEKQMENNPEQIHFIKQCLAGQNCILIGAAGTGKTSTQGLAASALIQADKISPLTESTERLVAGTPGVVVVSFTNKAVNNIRWKLPEDLRVNCMTIHKLLEFKPHFYEVEDTENPGKIKISIRFEPERNKFNPLPASLKLIIFEEASMVSVELYQQLMDAMPHSHQQIMLGDLYQLPPVYGSSILGFKLLEWPVVELTRIYRQALESPIISFAWKIKNGEKISSKTEIKNGRVTVPAFDSLNVPGKLHIRPWQKKLDETHALLTAVQFFCLAFDAGQYTPEEDIILIPFNVGFGSIELNKGIMQHLGTKRGAVVWEILAGFQKHYLAVGDKVLYEKEDHEIIEIVRNAEYLGARTQKESTLLDRWGHYREPTEAESKLISSEIAQDESFTMEEIDKFLAQAASAAEDKTNQASHIIHLRRLIDGEEVTLNTTGEVNNILGGYAITVHKAQGSEWKKVFCIFHHTHAVMMQRELLYTAVTRAKDELYIICESTTFEKGVASQKIKGTTLAEKAEFFKGKLSELEAKQMEMFKNKNPLQKSREEGKPLAIKIEDLVPEDIARLAREKFDSYWEKGLSYIPTNKPPAKPRLTFDIHSKNTLGKADYRNNRVRLNAVYLACDDPIIRKDMLEDTIIHEICHILANAYYKERGHKFWWKSLMRKFGISASRLATVTYPPFLQERLNAWNNKLKDLTSEQLTETEDEE